MTARMVKRVFLVTAASGTLGGALWYYGTSPSKVYKSKVYTGDRQLQTSLITLPTRAHHMSVLKKQEFDVLVIGGGATGTGVALDAATRGLTTALVERADFASGTSSRSTKLIHGGVRYLQKAIFGLDKEQYKMVEEALAERGNLLDIAPHLAHPLPIMLPVYKLWQLPYFYAGIKAYDLVAGRRLLRSSYIMSKSQTLEEFPMLRKDKLIGSIIYYDGQHDDARMCLAIAITAAKYGASLANHTEVVRLVKGKGVKKDGEDTREVEVINGAVVRDKLTGEEFTVRAKCVVNATGPFTDGVRKMDNPEVLSICQPSCGVHVVLPEYYSPKKMGLLDPSTSDGRVIFFIPWLKSTLAGTTDNPCPVSENPESSEKEVNFILEEIKRYLNSDVMVRRSDVLSTWSGIRPLVSDPSMTNTQSIARNHIIDVSDSNLITIAGGKWTTYRSMAEETVDKCLEVSGLVAENNCETKGLLLDGAHQWTPSQHIRLIQEFNLDIEVAEHLASTYGDKCTTVARLAQSSSDDGVVGRRLHHKYPFIEAEVIHAISEYAERAVDVLGRRTRLSFLNAQAAMDALPRVVEIMSQELGWSKSREQEEIKIAEDFLQNEMGLKFGWNSESKKIK